MCVPLIVQDIILESYGETWRTRDRRYGFKVKASTKRSGIVEYRNVKWHWQYYDPATIKVERI